MKHRSLASIGLIGLALTFSASAFAHLTLTAPTARLEGETGDPELKEGPCGQAVNGRTQNVTTFMPGETIMVTFDEYIDHDGYYRVAFDDDGDDVFDTIDPPAGEPMGDDPETAHPLSANILGYFKEGREGPNAASYSMEVTLPTAPCTNCTLQVIQYMYGSANPNYYQCADIIIGDGAGGAGGAGGAAGAAGAGGAAGAAGAGGAAGAAVGGAAGAAVGGAAGAAGGAGGSAGGVMAAGAGGAAVGGAGTAGVSAGGAVAAAGTVGAAGATAGTTTTSSASSGDDGSCALAHTSSSNPMGLWLFAVSSLLLGLQRRRTR